jgi:tetratricopeptide (TPR) repeat protein
VPVENRLSLGFFKRLFTPQDEEDFVDGLRAYVEKDEQKALKFFHQSQHIADAVFMGGFIDFKQGRFSEAVSAFLAADKLHKDLGRYFSKYGISLFLTMNITDEITAHIAPTRRGLLLGLVEAYQELKEYEKAVEVLMKLRRLVPDDVLVKVSLAELVLEAAPDDRKTCSGIVKMASDVENESNIHAALLLYKARALRSLGLQTAARDALTAAARRKKDRNKDLLKAINYERALVYEELGERSRARAEFEKLYAEDPSFEDVAARLGI